MENTTKRRFEIIHQIAENYKSLGTGLTLLQFILFISFYLFKKSSLFLTLLIGILNIGVYILSKDLLEEADKRFGFRISKFAILLISYSLVNHLFYIVIYKNLTNATSMYGLQGANPNTAFKIAFLFNFAVSLGALLIMKKDETKEVLEQIYEESLLEKMGIYLNEFQRTKGDVLLCTNLDTEKPVYIPFKDRFLHMLILGPTGSGKTSQIIIPMINQDMQNEEAGITVIEPKGDLAEKVYAMAQHYGREAIYFNPILDACPTFNPLFGKEEDVIENMVTTFKMLNPDSQQFFHDMNEQLIRNALKVIKRLKGNSATLIDLERLVANPGGEGRKMVNAFSKLPAPTEGLAKENQDITNYFLGDYFAERSKTYEHCSGFRAQMSKVVSNKFLRKVLNPTDGTSDINFDTHLENGGVIAIATAQGKLRDLGSFLGYFIILNFQSAVFKRPGDENTRRPHFLYIDEFQVYSNPGFADMLTQGRSYRVASHLATQNRALIGMGGGKAGEDFIELVSTNARNVVVFPGANYNDAKYYSDQFGEILEKKETKGISRAKFDIRYGFQKISYPNESIRYNEEFVARYSPSDIIYRDFGEVTYAIISNNTLQVPSVGKISYIPAELNAKLDQMILENNALMMNGKNPNECRDLSQAGKLHEDIAEKIEAYIEDVKKRELEELIGLETINKHKEVATPVSPAIQEIPSNSSVPNNIEIIEIEDDDSGDQDLSEIIIEDFIDDDFDEFL